MIGTEMAKSSQLNIDNNKDQYYELCTEIADIPLFMQAWWMDAVCNNNDWDVLFYEKNNNILAFLVFFFVNKLGYKVIIQPQLTQYNGIWICKSDFKSASEKLSFEKDVYTNLILQLNDQKISYFDQNFHPTITNWLPFFWKGFTQTTRYTYQIENISDVEKCYEKFSYAKKKQITKAKKNLTIYFELPGDIFYDELKQNLKVLNQDVYFTKERFLSIYNQCQLRNQGCIIAVRDNQMKIHAANFIVWDKNCAYNLISTINKEFRSSGATSLIIWEAIKLMSTKTKIFDFEGSMNENIENSFRQFGTIQVPYFRIIKNNSLSLKLLLQLKNGFN